MTQSILVTGGAGFIGSHTAKVLAARGLRPVVFDNLSAGFRETVRWGPFAHGDIRDEAGLREAMRAYEVSGVIHFAGLTEVGRSMSRPDLFWEHNVAGVATVLSAMRACGVTRLAFSSSAAVYGGSSAQATSAISEDAPKAPDSVYGETKLAGERMIEAHCRAFGLNAIALRYFNAAGADPDGELGEAKEVETHLIPLAIDAALGTGRPLTVFGGDFSTPDGSCLRDYVHVDDLARAHAAALDALAAPLGPGRFGAMNVGSGAGRSVLEVVAAVDRIVGRPTPHVIGPRRAGDPAGLVADTRRIRQQLDWTPAQSTLDRIIETAVAWRRAPRYGRCAAPNSA